jgi:hypothetical protein
MSIDLKTLPTACTNAKPGDVILLKDGIYPSIVLNIYPKGLAGQRITIKPENPGKVIITGTSTIYLKGSYTTLANLVFKDGGATSKVLSVEGDGNRITGCDFSFTMTDCEGMVRLMGKKNRIDHCIFHDWNKLGVWAVVWRPNLLEDFALIDHNIFRNRSSTTATNGLECVRIGTSNDSLTSSKTIVAYNLIDNCNGEIEAISNKSCDNIFYRNTYLNSEGTLTLRHGNRCIVYRNVFDQKGKANSGGIRVTGEEHIVAKNCIMNVNGNATTRVGISMSSGIPNSVLNGYFQVKKAKIQDNTLINCSNDFAIGVKVKTECTLPPITSEITGNTVYHSDSKEVFSSDSSCLGSTDMTYIGNKIYATNMGTKAPLSSGLQKLSPSTFDLASFTSTYETLYGTNETVGPQWEVAPETTEITQELDVYYSNFKQKIISEMPSTALTTTTTATSSNTTAPTTTTSSNTTVPNTTTTATSTNVLDLNGLKQSLLLLAQQTSTIQDELQQLLKLLQ